MKLTPLIQDKDQLGTRPRLDDTTIKARGKTGSISVAHRLAPRNSTQLTPASHYFFSFCPQNV